MCVATYCTIYVCVYIAIAPYITHPSTDNCNNTQLVTSSTRMVSLTCSLNVIISSSMTVTWLHNNSIVMTTPFTRVMTDGKTATLEIRSFQLSSVGIYQCIFNNTAGYILRRNISLLCKFAY